MSKRKKETYEIAIRRPDGVSVAEMRAYIRDAVSSWGGQFEPPNEDNNYTGDPLFGHHIVSVRRTNFVNFK